MLVQFNGNLISTDLVYKITPVIEHVKSSKYRTASHDPDHRTPFYFAFVIFFLNGQTETFTEDANYDPKNFLSKEEYDKHRSPELCIKAADEYRKMDEYKKQRQKIDQIYNDLLKKIDSTWQPIFK